MKLKSFLILISILLFSSCKTYTISVDSFKNQMSHLGYDDLKEVKINNPTPNMNKIGYYATNLKSITVIDKKGNEVSLSNSPRLEMRVTRKNGKRYILLFDTVIVENDSIKGLRSKMLGLTREIPLSDITKIEIQDSGKVYKYQE
jgi:RNA:NAD 2'-phosphotransferase (TPT1/KptA family)